MTTDAHADWELIKDLGGPAKVAQVLGYTKEGGPQRVQNWKFRGIPAQVKVNRPDLFMRSARVGIDQGHVKTPPECTHLPPAPPAPPVPAPRASLAHAAAGGV